MRKSKYNSFDELPLMLTVEDVSHVLGIGLAHAYEVCDGLRLGGVRGAQPL